MNITTRTLSGAEISVAIGGQNTEIRNDGAATVYASANSGIVAGADGVVAIPAGAAVTVLDTRGRVYLLGTGEVSIVGKDTVSAVFKCAPSEGVAVNYSNPNLLINPDFRVNQRGASGTISAAGYFVDRWQLTDGTVTVNSDGMIALDGTITQVLEFAVGADVTATASAGTATYDDATRTFTLTAAGEIIKWAKLEVGGVATKYSPPNRAIELAKCQRYLQKLNAFEVIRAAYVLPDYIDFSISTPVTMRSVKINIEGEFEVYPFPISTPVSGFTYNIQTYAQNQLRLRATKTAHGLSDAVLMVPSGKSVLLSAEL